MQCIHHFIAIIGRTEAQFSTIKYQKKKKENKEKGMDFIRADKQRPLWGSSCEVLP